MNQIVAPITERFVTIFNKYCGPFRRPRRGEVGTLRAFQSLFASRNSSHYQCDWSLIHTHTRTSNHPKETHIRYKECHSLNFNGQSDYLKKNFLPVILFNSNSCKILNEASISWVQVKIVKPTLKCLFRNSANFILLFKLIIQKL